MTAGDLALRAGSVERTRARAVAESLSAVAALARVPVVDDHLHRHLASPNASGAFLLVGSCRQSPVTAFAVDRKRRWNTTPRWRRCLFHNLTYSIFQIADLVELNGLQTRIGNRQCFAGDGITHLELVFGVRAFPHANEKFSDLIANVAAHPERVTQIRVTARIERTGPIESAAARKSKDRARVFSQLPFSSGRSSRTSFQTVFVMESTQDRLGHNLVINRNAVSAESGLLLAGP